MNEIGIVTDSHSGISKEEADRLGIYILPMPFFIDDECYYENVSLSREEFFQAQKEGRRISTSQPTPEDVKTLWRNVLENHKELVYIPISSGLSGSCATAQSLAQEKEFSGRVYVVDNGRVATPLHRCILDTVELVQHGYSGEEIKNILQGEKDKVTIYLAVKTLEYLKKGGRISPAVAVVGTAFNISPILKLNIGMLESYKKCHGFTKAKKAMLAAMKQDIETRFKEEYEKGGLYLMAASTASPEETEAWVQEIKQEFPGMEVMCDNLTLGVACHTGQGALGIGCSCKPVM